jgi:translocation and assembly module TamA
MAVRIMPSSGVARRHYGVWLMCFALSLWGQITLADAVIISIEGLDGALRDNALKNLSLATERERDPSSARVRELHQKAPEEIRAALQPFGYYRSKIESSLERVDDDVWRARYVVEAGPPLRVRFSNVVLQGDGQDDPAFRALVDNFSLKRGSVLNHVLYEDSKRQFQATAVERGYFDMRFARHQLLVDLESYHADVALTVDTGIRYRFGEVSIDQNILEPSLLDRYIRISPGMPYSTTALIEAQNALTASDFFSDVDVEADPEQAKDGAVPVQVRLEARSENRYTVGAGYGTDTGPRGQASWERRYINRKGHQARIELRGSEVERSVSTGYFVPIRNPRTDKLAVTAGYNEGRTRTAQTEVSRFSVNRTTARGRLVETLSLTRQDERFTIGNESGVSELTLPGVTWSYILAEDRIFTRFGARLLLDIRGASERFASDTSLLQVRAGGKFIVPLADVGRFIARGEIGATGIDEFAVLPASLRFFAGGDVSVRGYAYNSLGPVDSDGDVVGGKHLLIGSAEYEHRIAGNWAAAIFYDTGNALNRFNDALKKGAGIGVRWRSPVGQIRLDVAQAISEPERPWRVHLTLGPDL